MSDNFFSRWSRRKQGLETREPPQPVTTPMRAPASAALPAEPPASPAPTHPLTQDKAGPVPEGMPTKGTPPLPTLDDVQNLTPASDFQAFMQQGVPGEVRNAAMKKLFTDPHFNVMDGLDIYIGDYNTPDPLPAGMLKKMVGAEFLNLFPAKLQHDVPQGGLNDVQVNPEQSPAQPKDTPLVAQSSPSMTPPKQATPPLQSSEPTDHDHPDL